MLPVNDIYGDKVLPRWEHTATIGWNTREFIVMLDRLSQQAYIEEIVGGHLEKIQDDNLWSALVSFAEAHGFTGIKNTRV